MKLHLLTTILRRMSIRRFSYSVTKINICLFYQNVRSLYEKHAVLFIINSNMSSWLKYLGKESRRVHVFPVSRGAVQSPATREVRYVPVSHSVPSQSLPPPPLLPSAWLPYHRFLIAKPAKTGLHWMQRNFDPCSISWAAQRARGFRAGL